VSANERRAELMRILIGRRHETMRKLADELGVSDRTIRTDISALTSEHPLETVRGNGGCVKLADWYRPNKNILSQEQQRVLSRMIEKGDEYQAKVLREIVEAYGKPNQKQQKIKEYGADDRQR
jgi:predicted DNA-binding transcriptional regulator YafY